MAMSLADFMASARSAGSETAFEQFKEFVETTSSRIAPTTVYRVLQRVPDFLKEVPPAYYTLAIDFVTFMLEGIAPRFVGAHWFYKRLALIAIRGTRVLASGSIIGFTEAITNAKARGEALSPGEYNRFLEKALEVPIETIKNPVQLTKGQHNYMTLFGAVVELRKQGWIGRISTSTFWMIVHLLESGNALIEQVANAIPELTDAELKAKLVKIDAFLDLTEKAKLAYRERRRLSGENTPAGISAKEAQSRGDNPLSPRDRKSYDALLQTMQEYLDECRPLLTALQMQSGGVGFWRRSFVVLGGTFTDRILNTNGGERFADSVDGVWDLLRKPRNWIYLAVALVAILVVFLGPAFMLGLFSLIPLVIAVTGASIEAVGVFSGVLFLMGFEIMPVWADLLLMFVGASVVALITYGVWPLFALFGEILRNLLIENKYWPTSSWKVGLNAIYKILGRPTELENDVQSTQQFVDLRIKGIPWRDPQWLLKPITGLWMACVLALLSMLVVLPTASLFSADSIARSAIGILFGVTALSAVLIFEVWRRSTRAKSVEKLGEEADKLQTALQTAGLSALKWVAIPVFVLILLIGIGFSAVPKRYIYSCPSAESMLALSQEDLALAIPAKTHRDYCVDTKIRPLLTRR